MHYSKRKTLIEVNTCEDLQNPILPNLQYQFNILHLTNHVSQRVNSEIPTAFLPKSEIVIHVSNADPKITHARLITIRQLHIILQTHGQVEYLKRMATFSSDMAEEAAMRFRAIRKKVVLALIGESVPGFGRSPAATNKESALFKEVKHVIGFEESNREVNGALFLEKSKTRKKPFYFVPRESDAQELKRYIACLNALIKACVGRLSAEEVAENTQHGIPKTWYSKSRESKMPPELQWDALTAESDISEDPNPNEDLYFPGTEGGKYRVPGIRKSKKALTKITLKSVIRIWRQQVKALQAFLLTSDHPDFIPPSRRNTWINRKGEAAKILAKAGISMPSGPDLMGNDGRERSTFITVRAKIAGISGDRRECLFPTVLPTTENKRLFRRLELRLQALDALLEQAASGLETASTYVQLGDTRIPLQTDEQRNALLLLDGRNPPHEIKKQTVRKAWALFRKVILLFDVPIPKFFEEGEVIEKVAPAKNCLRAWNENAFGYGVAGLEETLWIKNLVDGIGKYRARFDPQLYRGELITYMQNLLDLLSTFGETESSLQSSLESLPAEEESGEKKVIEQKLNLLKKYHHLVEEVVNPPPINQPSRKSEPQKPGGNGTRRLKQHDAEAQLEEMLGHRESSRATLLAMPLKTDDDALAFLIAIRPHEEKDLRKSHKDGVSLLPIAINDQNRLKEKGF